MGECHRIDGRHAQSMCPDDARPAARARTEVESRQSSWHARRKYPEELLEFELGPGDLIGRPGETHAATRPVRQSVVGLVPTHMNFAGHRDDGGKPLLFGSGKVRTRIAEVTDDSMGNVPGRQGQPRLTRRPCEYPDAAVTDRYDIGQRTDDAAGGRLRVTHVVPAEDSDLLTQLPGEDQLTGSSGRSQRRDAPGGLHAQEIPTEPLDATAGYHLTEFGHGCLRVLARRRDEDRAHFALRQG